jgi:hypothetical protein
LEVRRTDVTQLEWTTKLVVLLVGLIVDLSAGRESDPGKASRPGGWDTSGLARNGVVPVVEYGDALADKVIVDISNPFNATFDGLAHSEETSIAQEVAKVAPAGASVVKACNTIFRNVLEKGRPDVFMAGDSAQAKASVKAFIESIGLRPLDVDGLKNGALARRIGPDHGGTRQQRGGPLGLRSRRQ